MQMAVGIILLNKDCRMFGADGELRNIIMYDVAMIGDITKKSGYIKTASKWVT